MDKHDIAHILDQIGVLLELKGENPFKIRAYHNAARAIENLDEDIHKIVEEEMLEEIPGIGKKIAKKITTLIKKGKLPYFERLKKATPDGLLQLLHVPGLGGKKIKTLHTKLRINTTEDLLKACHTGKIAKLKGFGEKTQANILSGITKLKEYGRRILWWDADTIGEPILKKLTQLKSVKKAAVAGSYRRKLETVGDLDFVAASSSPDVVMDWFTKLPEVAVVLSKGSRKSSVRLKEGIQADIRVVPEHQYAFTLLYFTGSKNHNISLRQRALKQGLSLNEYELSPVKKKKIALPKKITSEEQIYKTLGLSYIPPELRENLGEIEAAEKGKLPKLIEEKDIRGAFHCHTTETDGHNTLEEMVSAGQDLGWEYIGISDHSKSSFQASGMDEERLFAQLARIRKLNDSKKFSTHIFAGLECDILNNGTLDFSNSILKELDCVIVSIHRSFNMTEEKMTQRIIKAIENPYTTILAHVTGRLLLKRDPYAINLPKIIDACIANGKVMELNAFPTRLDMDWQYWHKAKEKGLKCSINPDAHSTAHLLYIKAGVNAARKGWLEKDDVINTLSLSQMKKFLKPSK